MRLFRKPAAALFGAALALSSLAAKDDGSSSGTPGATPTPATKKKSSSSDSKKDSGKKKDKDKGKKSATPDPSDPNATPPPNKAKLSLPIIAKHDSYGLKVPYVDEKGNLQMIFHIGVASRVDDDNVKMSDTQVVTYNVEGEPDMTVDLPVSFLDLNTRVITSHTKTTITREDFKITGDAVAFDTVAKTSKLVGNVHMTIYNLDDETGAPTEKSATAADPSAPADVPAAPEKTE